MQFNATCRNVPLQTVRWNAILVCLKTASQSDLRKRNRLSVQTWTGGKKKTSTQKMRRYPRAVLVHALGILAVCVFASILIFIQYFLRADQWLFLEGGEKKKHPRSHRVQLRREAVIFFYFFFTVIRQPKLNFSRRFSSRLIKCPDGFSIKWRVIFFFFQTLINWDYICFTRPPGQTKTKQNCHRLWEYYGSVYAQWFNRA